MQNLSAAERMALLELLEATAPKQVAPVLSQIQPADRSGPLPLSFAQWRLWFLDQLGIPGAVYHIPTRMRLRGELDRDALLRALNRVLARHEALRTTFAEEGEEQVQRIAPAAESLFQLAEHDLRGHPQAGAELRRLLAEETLAPFDLARGPLIRGHLIRLADADQVLHITMHHIVSDGWSMGVFTRELSTLYATFRAGEPDPLPPLPIQYADFAVWQRRWVDGEVLKAQADYWKETLAGAPALLELPTDRPRPPRQDFAGGEIMIELDAELTAALKALCQRHGVTLYMLFLAAWAVVLSRLSGQEDVVIGTPVAGRGRREIEGLIGFFVNTLAIRIELSGSLTVAELLRRVRDRALGAQDRQDIPFEQVVELIQPVRTLAHTPLFQVMFNWLNMPERDLQLSGLAMVSGGPAPAPGSAPVSGSAGVPEAEDASAPFDLALSLSESRGRIAGALEYASALFDPETIARHEAYLRRVLAQMVADERRSVAGLALMSPAERAQVVEGWNATELPCPDGACVHELFERRAEETPHATAVVFEGGELTYAALNARANRLAHRLRALGVGPDARVAICAERSPEMVAGLLAVLKAGGAYVPLDPAYPEERLRWLVEDSAPVAVLAHGSLAARFAVAGVPVLELDADAPVWSAGPETNPELEMNPGRGALLPEHLAYVIYTSGSTGRPKGVMVPHHAVQRQAAAVQAGFGLRPEDRSLQFASVAFDAAVEEIFGALLTGAALVLRTEAWLEGAAAFWGRCAENGVTVIDLPTRFWQLLLDEPAIAVPACVRLLAIGGEAVEPSALEAWFRRAGHRPRLLNTYGPTETTVNATFGEIVDDPATWRSIGRPVANTRAYLLDVRGEPVPVGVAGELYIGGGQVARGYLDRPGLSAGRFVPDPFARERGARLYRTGDLARWRTDGTIEFLGRTDFQVKIRGFRIELGEIEARLAEHADVRDAVVMAREDAPGDRRLVAYCVADEALDVESLRAHLAQRLPSYMVPAAFVRLDAFPATAGGKVDRRALPAPEGDELATRGYEAPASHIEAALAEIWAEVLRVERVGRRDSFFDLGGHSLLAVQVISRVRQRLSVEVALRDLFTRPVLADFARGLETASRAELPPIEPVERGADLPLSFAQQRLWFIERLEGPGAAYHIPVRQRLRGNLDRTALRRALDRIMARHEALRTVFAEVDGAPVQRIAPAEASAFPLAEHDLRGAADGPAEFRLLAADEARAPFDLEHGPLVRGRLVQIGDDDHVLLITMHHIVSDGWSMGVFTRELGALYGAFREGRPDPLPPLAVQYADYAAWQRRWVEGEVLREQAEYWTTTLAGAPELLALPGDRPRPARQDVAGATVPLVLDEALSAALKELSRRHRTTLHMTLLAGWAALLARLSGQDDVVVGTPTANRGREEIEGLIGFFVNMLPVRVELSDGPTVAALLARVRERALGAQHHQDIPFEKVVELVQPARSMAHAPLFQAMFTWQNAPGGGAGLPGLALAPLGPAGPPEGPGASAPATQATAKVDLSLSLWEAGGRIMGSATYATALFDQATAERWLGYLRRMLEGMAAGDGQPVDRLALLDGAERGRVLQGWNPADAARPWTCVHERFEAQVARTPGAVALVFEDRSLTYAELNARANRLAHHLRGRGVGPDVRVAVCIERSPELMVAFLAVLKSGGAYVPLDPGDPEDRLRHMLDDGAPAALLVHAGTAARFAGEALPVIDVDAGAGEWAGASAMNPAREDVGLTLGHLAYVIYTSGSTGRPKGVMVEHRALANVLGWMGEAWPLGADDVVLQKTPVSFDASARELFPPLLAGARMVIARPGGHRDPAYLVETIRREGVTTLHFVPTMLGFLLEEPGIERCTSIARVVCGGEALPAALARRAAELLPHAELHNVYGPTEAAVDVTWLRCPADAAGPHVSIGRPMAGCRAYFLDRAGEPVPAGVAGELYLGGVQVARGYLGRAALTAERFLPDAFGGEPGARLYRTGDLGRWRPDGSIEFLGRNDFQVKLRGFRIELGEIEARLREHAAVREAVVVAREERPGVPRLVAYWTGEERVEAEALRRHAGERLPEHMVPAAYVRLDALPLTSNGKLDRKALPAPEGDAFATRGYEAPLGETEQALAEIWSELLGVDEVGRRDHFFELGGHSLLAVRVISRVRQVLGAEVALGELFRVPVLADLARAIEDAARTELPPIQRADRRGRLPLSFAQQRLWFLEQLGGLGSTYHIPRRLRLRGDLDRAALRRALDAVLARHEALRTTFVEVDGEPLQRIAEEGRFHLLEHDLGGHPDAPAELRRLAAQEADAPFDLERGPLIRGRLVRMGDDGHVLLITLHHIVSDAWSAGVLMRELGALYDAFRRGDDDPLAPLPVQYADYALWQRTWVDGEVLREQAEYWKATLAGAPELLELPTDRPRPARHDHAGGTVGIHLDAELTAALKALGRRHGTTLFMTVLAGWAAVLGRLSGQHDVVVGTPSANRGRAEIEGLIGFFINTLALRVDLSGSPSVAEVLGRVRERALGAQHHQDIPFEQVVELVQPVRSLSHTPLFQVMFSWQAASENERELSGLAPASRSAAPAPAPRPAPAAPAGPAEETTAKFDLSLALVEQGGRIVGALEYAAALFDRATVERFAGYLHRALAAMAEDEHRSLDRLPLLPDGERRRVLETWNRTEADYPAGTCVHQLFQAQVARTPDVIALSWQGQRWTYAELETRANRLAHALRRRGVGPEVRVGICLPRTPDLVAAMLGVLKAGGAYVPLDPAYPRERLGYMLQDAAVSLVITDSALADRLPEGSAALLLLDGGRDAIAAESADAPSVVIHPENLSHVIFTSGSTGRPKGVMIRHASTVVLLHWLRENVTDEERASVLFSTSINFDVSVAEVFGTLAWGGTLVLVENALELATVAEPVVYASMVPSAAAELLRSGGIPATVRTLNLGGEALPNALAQGLYALPGIEKVGNLYGPTEDTTYSTYSLVPRGAEQVFVGRPVANTQAYVLDRHLQPVPMGAAGELYLAGDGLSRGYANHPAMTAERFLPNPFGPAGSRMYRVMDRVRWREDAEGVDSVLADSRTDALTHSRTAVLEYLGRTDFQVKVRGYRIELGEIEARLAEHPGVRAPVVRVREDAPGDRRLVAYYLGDAPVAVDALKVHLADRLPGYMVPAAYVWMETYPLTPNGKTDRKALPAPEGDAYAAHAFAAPLGETEEALAGIWAEVLGVERVGRHDSFFELGGHSLLAVRVISRVRQALAVEATLGDLFLRPVLTDFARGLAGAAAAELPPIGPAPRDGRLPLSFAQQRLWFLEQLGELGSTYHIPTRMRLRGALDRGALVRALDTIVARHEALRTVFAVVDGVPEQRIAPADAGFRLVEHDLGGHADAQAELGRLAAGEARARFDLERGPLIRGRLVRLAADDHVLLLTMHHIVSDGWSMGVLTRELSALYDAFRRGEPDPLPPLPIQYADYAVWQRKWVDGEVLREQAEYWTTTLAGAPELLELPADHPRPAEQDHAGAWLGVELDEALTAGLTALGRRHGTTLYMTLLAGWATLLGRLSGQGEVVVGTPTANRGRAEIEGLIGFFVNMLPVRVDLSDGPTGAALLARVREAALGAQHHQDIPFEQVVELVQPARSMAHAPVFQAMFTWQNAPGDGAGLPGLTVAPAAPADPPREAGAEAPSGQATAHVDLSLVLAEQGGRIAGSVTYAAALFERSTVERYVGYLRRVLEGMVADDTRPVDRLRIVPEAERRRMVEEWSRTADVAAGDACVHQRFEARVEEAPDAAAVVFNGGALTYAELNARANRLARRLRAAGVRPDAPVGVMLERSVELIVALLAVLKAGGAYLPLDPALPAARRAALAADAGAAVLVARDSGLEGFAGTFVAPADADGDGSNLGLDVPAAALAYVIYTSGSTGTPKGVGVAHAEAAAHCRAAGVAYGYTPADRVMQFAAIGFDVSVEQMMVPLLAGACIVVRANDIPTPLELAREAAEQGLTLLNVPTAYWHQVAADTAAMEILGRTIRMVLTGGETMSPAAARAWTSGPAAGVRLLNGYGPTEAVVTCTGYDVPATLPDEAVHVPVGRPLPGRAVYVLDGWMQPAPLGVPGELCVGGLLARGYLGRPAATAAAFVPDPFSATPGARMYRTGDRARWLEESAEVRECVSAEVGSGSVDSRTNALTHSRTGVIEFQGRRDFQVKVRGFRVELGEIEARLAEHPRVREGAVVARDDTPGDLRLVAYVVGTDAVEVDEVRTYLAERLPAYMVPSAFVRLEALPLTPNGKLDRRALPAPDASAPGTTYEAPVGDTEEALARVFAQVLGVERVGRRDNFFELGGHSLLAVRVVARVRQVLGVEAPLAHLFSHPTVESLAARVSGAEPRVQDDRAVAIRPSGSQPPLFLVHEGAGSIAYAQVLHPHVGGDIPVYALPAPPSSEPPLRTVEEMAARMVRMIRQVQPAGPYRLAGWSFGGVLAYEAAAQLIGRGETVELVGMFDSYHPVRARAVVRDAAQEHALLLHVLRMAEAVQSDGRVDPDEAGAATGGVDLETFVARCHEKGLLPGHVTVEQARRMRDLLRGNGAAMRAYAPQPLAAAVHLFPAGHSADPELSRGWQATIPAARLRVTPVPGTHLSMMQAPNAAILGEALSRALDRAREGAAPLSAGGFPLPGIRGGTGAVAAGDALVGVETVPAREEPG